MIRQMKPTDLYELFQRTSEGFEIEDHCYFREGEKAAIETIMAPEVAACCGMDILVKDKGLSKLFGDKE